MIFKNQTPSRQKKSTLFLKSAKNLHPFKSSFYFLYYYYYYFLKYIYKKKIFLSRRNVPKALFNRVTALFSKGWLVKFFYVNSFQFQATTIRSEGSVFHQQTMEEKKEKKKTKKSSKI